MTEKILKIEKILDRRKIDNNYEYKIKLEGSPLNESTWHNYSQLKNLTNGITLIEEYNKEYPIKEDENENENKYNKKEIDEINNNENKNNDEISKTKNDFNDDYNDENSKILIYENEYSYKVDNSLLKVIKIKKENGKLLAVVEKMKENGEKYEEIIPTEELRSINPWILLDFYESRIKFI